MELYRTLCNSLELSRNFYNFLEADQEFPAHPLNSPIVSNGQNLLSTGESVSCQKYGSKSTDLRVFALSERQKDLRVFALSAR